LSNSTTANCPASSRPAATNCWPAGDRRPLRPRGYPQRRDPACSQPGSARRLERHVRSIAWRFPECRTGEYGRSPTPVNHLATRTPSRRSACAPIQRQGRISDRHPHWRVTCERIPIRPCSFGSSASAPCTCSPAPPARTTRWTAAYRWP